MSNNNFFSILLLTGTLFCADNTTITVNRIDISGNTAIKDRELRSILRLKEPRLITKSDFDRRILRLDAIILKNYYISRGFLTASVTDSFALREDNTVDLFFRVNEGPRTILGSVVVNGNQSLLTKKILKTLDLETGRSYNPIGLNTRMSLLEGEYSKIGKLFTDIKVFESIEDTIELVLEIVEGPDVFINDILVRGNENIDAKYILREVVFNPGSLYQQELVDETEKRITETGIFSYVNIVPTRVSDSDSRVDLTIELRKFKPRELISEGGFYPFQYKEVAEELPSIGGNIEWRNRNLFESLRRFSIKTSANLPIIETINQWQFIKFTSAMTLSSQWFLGFRLPTSLSGYYITYSDFALEDNPRIQRYGVDLTYLYRLSERSFVRTGLQWEKFLQPESPSTTEIEKRTINADVRLDGSDNPLNPTQGSVAQVNLTSAGGILGGNRDFIKIDLGLTTYTPLFWRIVLAGRVKYGFIYGWDDTKYDDPQFDKFYLGGSTSMRGWDTFRFLEEKLIDGDGDAYTIPLGKPYRIMTNWELRIPIYRQIGCELFMDGGYLADSFQSLSVGEMQWNAGAGLVLQSPLGPIRVDYAIQTENTRNRMLLLGVLYAF
ncbi:MAG: BamA/TamA family outer membrane protein [Candidatus Neomarinimicrobiota bacterium]